MRPAGYSPIQKIGIIAVLVQSVFLVVFAAAMAGPAADTLAILLGAGAAYLLLLLYLLGSILRKSAAGAVPAASASRMVKLMMAGGALGALGMAAPIVAGPPFAGLAVLGLAAQLALYCFARYRVAG